MDKKWYLSKTIILNMICGVALALSAAIPALSSVNDFVHANAASIGMMWAVLGMILRSVSKGAIILRDEE